MPTSRGIQISLISQWELKIHPEFPHPESSQFAFCSPVPGISNSRAPAEDPLLPIAFDSKADRLLGRQTVAAVYVPSLSGQLRSMKRPLEAF